MTIYFFNKAVLVIYPKTMDLSQDHGYPWISHLQNNYKPVFPKIYPKEKMLQKKGPVI